MAAPMGLNVPEATSMAAENLPPKRPLNLGDLRIGSTIEIATASGSKYWVTITSRRRTEGDRIFGVSLMTSSETFGQVARSPQMLGVGKIVRVGEQFDVGSVKTSRVTGFHVM